MDAGKTLAHKPHAVLRLESAVKILNVFGRVDRDSSEGDAEVDARWEIFLR